MQVIEIQAERREERGRRPSRRARRVKKVPAIIYGPEMDPIPVYISRHDAEVLARQGKAFIARVHLDGQTYDTVVKEIQFHPVTDEVLHVDFQRFIPGRPIKIQVPIEPVGTPEGVVKGGILVQKMRRVWVKVLPEQLEETIKVDVSHLDLGQSLRVKDIQKEGWRILQSPEVPVVSVEIPRRLRAQMTGESEEAK